MIKKKEIKRQACNSEKEIELEESRGERLSFRHNKSRKWIPIYHNKSEGNDEVGRKLRKNLTEEKRKSVISALKGEVKDKSKRDQL